MLFRRRQKVKGKKPKLRTRAGGWLKNWCDYSRIKGYGKSIFDIIKLYFIPKGPQEPLALEQVMQRYDLTEADIQNQKKTFRLLALIMSLVTLSTIGYSIYHLIYARFIPAGISAAISLIPLALTFRYHFWYFQIQQRKLGCSFREWLKFGLFGAKQ